MRIALRSLISLPYQQKSPPAFAEGFVAISATLYYRLAKLTLQVGEPQKKTQTPSCAALLLTVAPTSSAVKPPIQESFRERPAVEEPVATRTLRLSQLLQVFPARIDRARPRHPCGDAGMTIAALGGEGRAAAVDVWKLPN